MKRLLCAALAAVSLGAVAQVEQKDFPCAVYLCLGNPDGATAEPTCEPPINWLYSLLRKRKPFPRCEDAEKSGMQVQFVNDPYDHCPEPLVPAMAGTYVATGQMVPMTWKGQTWMQLQATAEPAVSENPLLGEYAGQMPAPRACVGNLLGTLGYGGGDGGGYQVNVYDTVTWLQPQNPRALDLYSNGQWMTRNRY